MQPKIEVKQEPAVELDQGICRTCIHARGCSLRADPSKPVHACEEFSTGPAAEAPNRLRLINTPDSRSEPSTLPEGLRGLCINCEYAETCTLPRPAGGVWHCEEYK